MPMIKGTPKFDFVRKKKLRGSYADGSWKEPWKDFNPNCAKCKFRNDERTWASVGTCNYAFINFSAKLLSYLKFIFISPIPPSISR